MAQLKETTIDGKLTILDNNLYLDNGNTIYSTNTSGENRSLVQLNASNQSFFGYGGYSNSEGASYFDGNDVNIRSKGGIYMTSPDAGLTARQYGMNKVIWDGSSLDSSGYYMTEGHTATLTESVFAQPNGIVLVFSFYANGAAENAGFNYIFVPKSHITLFDGCGVSCFLQGYASDTGTNVLGFKYVYVNNDKIVGNKNNNYVGESNGVTLTSNKFILRYVIGV